MLLSLAAVTIRVVEEQRYRHRVVLVAVVDDHYRIAGETGEVDVMEAVQLLRVLRSVGHLRGEIP